MLFNRYIQNQTVDTTRVHALPIMKSDAIPAADDDMQTSTSSGTNTSTSTSTNTTNGIINNQSSSFTGNDSANETTTITELLNCLNHPPSNVVYFNNAGKVPIPPSVQQIGLTAVHQEANPWMEHDNSNLKIYYYPIRKLPHETRFLFAKLIGADASDIAITPSTG